MIGVKLPEMWSWDATAANRSACGITALREVAQAELLAALVEMPRGATGTVRRAHIVGHGLLLEYDRPVTRARRDKETGQVVLEQPAVPTGPHIRDQSGAPCPRGD